MRMTKPAVAAAAALCLLGAPSAQAREKDDHHDRHHRKVASVEFVGMPPPSTVDERADVYTKAQAVVTYRDGTSRTLDLFYHQLMATTDVVNGKVVGGIFDSRDLPITDSKGPMASDAPDGNSLMLIPGMHAEDPRRKNGLALVTQFEYREVPPDYPDVTTYVSHWSKLPATMGVTRLDQDKRTGALQVTDYDHVSLAGVKGGWIHCAASLSPWNTHLASEEYEPDAKVRQGVAPKAADTNDTTDMNGFSSAFFGNAATANAYDYGLVPEVKVRRDGKTSVVKHRALGRIARELVDVQPDWRTVYMGDDGGYTGLFMFVADRWGDLSEGTLYAAKWIQTSDLDGGSASLSWIRLGHSSDEELQSLVDGGIRFGDMFDVSNADPGDPTYKKVKTYTGTEWLRLKPGMEEAAAFLETRRYAAVVGATTEFSKMEGITHNAADRKAYVVISRVETGMTSIASDPQDDIRVARNDGGAIYELDLQGGQKDTGGHWIPSHFVAGSMMSIPELLGGWLGLGPTGSAIRDAEGNRCLQDKLCGPDNLKFSEHLRTLFIGEDTSRRNNNYVWAFHLDTRKLSRILSVPMYAEATGLQVVDGLNGFAYVMSNFQHPAEQEQNGAFKGVKDASGALVITEADVLKAIDAKWGGRKKAAIGYLGTADGALPGIR